MWYMGLTKDVNDEICPRIIDGTTILCYSEHEAVERSKYRNSWHDTSIEKWVIWEE